MATVVIAPDGFGGTLSARQAADAIAAGWTASRPDDEVITVPMSDGGEGLLEVMTGDKDRLLVTEVAGPLGRPVAAEWTLRADGSAVIESALACGLALVPPDERSVMTTTTYGVGQLLEAAREAGAKRIIMGLGGSATVDGGLGAMIGLKMRCLDDRGEGVKVGGSGVGYVDSIDRGWASDFSDIEVVLLADVDTILADAAPLFGPQKGASPADVALLTDSLGRFADVVERDLVPGRDLQNEPGSGAAGGLGFGVIAATGARMVKGSPVVADMVGLPETIKRADIVITGEGRLDATTDTGKVVTHVATLAREVGARVGAVVGQIGDGAPALDDVEAASQDGPGPHPDRDVSTAASQLAARWSVHSTQLK